jgi:nitroreductase
MPGAFDLTHTDHLLTTTRSVRKRLDLTRPVPREVILECLRIALQAPSGGNRQPWRWIVVDDPALKAQLAAIYRKAADPYLAAGRETAEAEQSAGSGQSAGRGDVNAILDSATYLNEHLAEVPVMVIPCLLGRLADGATVADTAGFYGSVLPAVWSFMLALRSRGLGSAWTTLHLPYEHEASAALGIPDTVTQTALLPVAYYTGDDFKPASRQPVEQVTYFNGWKKR